MKPITKEEYDNLPEDEKIIARLQGYPYPGIWHDGEYYKPVNIGAGKSTYGRITNQGVKVINVL